MSSLYDRLGVGRGADANEIKKAYRKMALAHHPDKGGNIEEFKQIQKAYEILSDDQRRTIYDQTGQESQDASDGIPFGGGNPFAGGGVPFDIGQIFGMFGPGGPGMQRQQQQQHKAAKGPPKIHELPISLADFFHGKHIRIQFERQKFCDGCKGSGAERIDHCGMCGGSGMKQQMMMIGPGMNVMMRGPCDGCGGEGKRIAVACGMCNGKKFKAQEKTLDFEIKPGMRPGEVIRFLNECSDQQEFIEAGDVHIHLQEADEALLFRRVKETDDLQVDVTVSLKESLLGSKQKIESHPGHPQGLLLEIPVGVQHRDVVILVGEGMPSRGGGRGNLRINVSVVASDAEKAALLANRGALEGIFSAVAS
jgi:DnaJ-class molecular chaperone